MLHQLQKLDRHLRTQNPLILNLTNVVTIDFVANIQLACGASPIMSFDHREIHELCQLATALYINIGTLNEAFEQFVEIALKEAHHRKIPIVLDPVGCGASSSRTKLSAFVAPYATLIKGNANEIKALADETHKTRGVDATTTTDSAILAGQTLLSKQTQIVVISGAHDQVISSNTVQRISYGSAHMSKVTGMGCALGGYLTAVAAASQKAELFDNISHATTHYALSGQVAATDFKGPASFKTKLIDILNTPLWPSIGGLLNDK